MSNIEILHFIWLIIIFTIIYEWTWFFPPAHSVYKYRMFSVHLTIIHPMTSFVTFVNICLIINQNLHMQKHQFVFGGWVGVYAVHV